MAEKSFFWTTSGTGDGTSGGYTALEMSEIWRDVILGAGEASQGVLRGVGNELAVSGTSSPLAVNTGSAVVYGKYYRNTASVNLTVSTPSVGTTGGHVILRLDWTAQTIRLVAVRNTDGINSTPSLTQSTSTQWEIRLATFTITTGGVITVTDARSYAYFATKVKTAMLDDSAVTTAKITDSNVTTAKINDGAVTSAKIADGTIATGDIANDAIDDTKAGNRVPQFYRRQGGSASDWSSAGTTTQTPSAVRMQAGVVSVSAPTTTAITFPVAFSQPPIVLVCANKESILAGASSVTASGFNIVTATPDYSGVPPISGTVQWLAIGPE